MAALGPAAKTRKPTTDWHTMHVTRTTLEPSDPPHHYRRRSFITKAVNFSARFQEALTAAQFCTSHSACPSVQRWTTSSALVELVFNVLRFTAPRSNAWGFFFGAMPAPAL